MVPLQLTSPQWLRALTLTERDSLLPLPDPSAEPPADQANQFTQGQKRLARWRAQAPFTEDTLFARRLAAANLTPERFLTLLSTPADSYPQSPTSDGTTVDTANAALFAWLHQLDQAYRQDEAASVADHGKDDQRSADASIEADQATIFEGESAETALADEAEIGDEATDEESDEESTDREIFGFLAFINPLIDQACRTLHAGISTLVESGLPLPFDLTTIEDILLVNLPDPLLMRISRTLVLELHIARLQGHLEGDTPEARFASFIHRLRDPDVSLAILADYPVLARQLVQCLNQWVAVSLEFLTRLCQDWPLIQTHFSPNADPGLLVELSGGAGDTHRNGHSVMIATFDSDFRIAYKPKSLQIDQHFQELLTWLNDKGCTPYLQTIGILDRGDYGWVEFVAYRSCDTDAELRRFFQRHGAYLALLYLLNSNDFHFENLIAVGEHPLLIDLETLLQPTFDTFDETRADAVAERHIFESVLQVGLLPMRMWSSDDYAGIDISGLGGMTGQLSPDRLLQLTEVGTDAMRYIRERIEIAGVANRPSLRGQEVNPTEYVEEIVAGFVMMYELLLIHRQEFLATDGPLERFANDEIRVLLRPTRTYDQLLTESFHPDLLHDALDRHQFLDRLWIAALARPYLAEVTTSEQAEMLRGDIPLFTTHPNSLLLYGAFSEGIPNVLFETGMNAVRRRVQRMGDNDLQRQLWFIRASIATLADASPVPHHAQALAQTIGRDITEPVETARAIAIYLENMAIHGMDDVAWIGMALWNQQYWMIRTLGSDLYNGLAGIALFLAYSGKATNRATDTHLARRTITTVVGQMAYLQDELAALGALEGWGGLLYTLTEVATLWQDEGIRYQAKGIVEIMDELIPQDDLFDIARGSAGAIITLLALHRATHHARALEVALACGEHLLATGTIDDPTHDQTAATLHWAIPTINAKQPSALLYGDLGIAWALRELADASGDARFAEAAHRTRGFDHATLCAEQANLEHWQCSGPVGVEIPGLMTGLAGIGYALLRAAAPQLVPPLLRTVQRVRP